MRIWWYLSSQLFKAICSVLIFTLVLYFLITYMDESQHYFDGYKVTQSTLFFYYFWQLPTITIELLPFTVLIGGIITNWLLAKHGEVAALRAAGMSMMRMARPLILVGLFFTFLQFGLGEFIIPYTSSQFEYVKRIEVEGKKADSPFTQSTWLKTNDSILHYQNYNIETQELLLPEFIQYKENSSFHIDKITHAKKAIFDEKINTWVLYNAISFHFKDSHNLTETDIKPRFVTNIHFAPPKTLKSQMNSNQLSYWQLHKLITEARAAGTNVSDRIVDLYLKLSLPFGNVLFVLLTLPFTLKRERQEDTYIGIVICLCAALIYWFGNLSLRSLAIKGTLNPILAAWTMNISVAVLCYFLLRKLDEGQ